MPEEQFEVPYGPLHPISYYAMAAQRYLATSGASRDQLAEVAVAAREWALLNPVAYTRDSGPLTVEDVLTAKSISTPLTAADCCLVTDGGGAVIVTSLERARDLAACPVVVIGYGERTTNTSMASVSDLLQTGAAAAGRDAYLRAGVGPGDIDVAQIYDSFTITVLLSLEALGFCPAGEAGNFVSDGRTRPGGTFPLNTSGGGLSYCHPGMLGLLLIVEAVRQLRGECGGRQVPHAQVALVHGTGGILSTHATLHLREGQVSAEAADEVTAEWWEATRQRQFVLQRCARCENWQHYPRALCIACGATELRFERASGRGRVDTWTEVMRSPDPARQAPYFVARVRLDEGPVLLTNLVAVTSGEDLIDCPVTVDWAPLPDGRNLPVFRPTAR